MKQYSRKEREEHLEKWRTGKLSKAQYAAEAGILKTTFYSWAHGQVKSGAHGFVEVTAKKPVQECESIILEKGMVIIRVPLSVKEDDLRKICNALGGLQ
jgi:hypothetical protein